MIYVESKPFPVAPVGVAVCRPLNLNSKKSQKAEVERSRSQFVTLSISLWYSIFTVCTDNGGSTSYTFY